MEKDDREIEIKPPSKGKGKSKGKTIGWESSAVVRALLVDTSNMLLSAADGQLTELTQDESNAAKAVAAHLADALQIHDLQAQANEMTALPANVKLELQRILEQVGPDTANVVPNADEAAMQSRGRWAIEVLSKIFSNSFESTAARHGLNFLLPAVRTGVIVFLAQLFQNYVAYELKKLDGLKDHPSSLTIATLSLMAINLALNLGGIALAHHQGTLTLRATLSRLFMMLTCIGIGSGVYAVGAWQAFAARAPSFFAYCYLRDAAQTIWKLDSNVSVMRNKALAAGGVIYAAAQFTVNAGTGLGTPLAGASVLPALNLTDLQSVLAFSDTNFNTAQTAGKSGMNGVADFIDDWLSPYNLRAGGKGKELSTQKLLKLQEKQHHDIQEFLFARAQELLLPGAQRNSLLTKINAEMYVRLDAYLTDRLKLGESRRDREALNEIRRFAKEIAAARTNGSNELPLASRLQRQLEDLPDFLTLDSQLQELFKDVISKEENADAQLNEVLQRHWIAEIFSRTFAYAYNPVAPTDLQEGVWEVLVRDNPQVFALQLLTQWRENTEAERKKIIATIKTGAGGTRIQSSFVLSPQVLVQRAIRSTLTTTAARQEFYWIVFGMVYVSAGLIGRAAEDEDYVLLESLLVALIVLIEYPQFYASHDSKPGNKQRIQLPGSTGALTEAVEIDGEALDDEEVDLLLQMVPSTHNWERRGVDHASEEWAPGERKPPALEAVKDATELFADKNGKADKQAVYLINNKAKHANDPCCIVRMMQLYLNSNDVKKVSPTEDLEKVLAKKTGTVFQKLSMLKPRGMRSLGYIKYVETQSALLMPQVAVFSVCGQASDGSDLMVVIARDRHSSSTWYCLDPNGKALAFRAADARSALVTWLNEFGSWSAEVLFEVPEYAQAQLIQEAVKPIMEGSREANVCRLAEQHQNVQPQMALGFYYAFEALDPQPLQLDDRLTNTLKNAVSRLEYIAECRRHWLAVAQAYQCVLPYELQHALEALKTSDPTESSTS